MDPPVAAGGSVTASGRRFGAFDGLLAGQSRHQAGADEGGFAAAGGADDGQEAIVVQVVDQLGGQGFAAEEDVRVALGEVAQALEGRLAFGVGGSEDGPIFVGALGAAAI